jgi:hypothetical protein
MSIERAQAVVVLPSARFFIERKRIVELAAKHQIPAMYQAREFVELGGLVAYGASIPDLFRRKAVRALGRTIPQSVLLQADQVFE